MARPLANRVVSEIMSTNLITVTPSTRLDQALKIMISNSISRLPVVEENAPNKLKGIVTDRDMRLASDSPFLEETIATRIKHLAEHKIGDIMKTGVVTVENSAPVLEAAKLMRVSKVGGLPVLDNNGSLVGICTGSDLLDHLIRILEPVPPTDKPAN